MGRVLRSKRHALWEAELPVKKRLRHWAKLLYCRTEPLLKRVGWALKHVEVFFVYPPVLSLPLPLAWKIFSVRIPWLFFRPSRKRLILDHLAQATRQGAAPERTRLLARKHAAFLSSIRFETQLLLACSPERVDRAVRFEGLSRVDAAQAEGKGVMLLGCHAGPFYRAIFASARRGYRLHVITMRPEDARQGIWEDRVGSVLYRRLLERLEQEPNVHMQYVGGSLLEVPRALKRGEIVCATLDVPLTRGEKQAVHLPFLGRECVFSSRLVRLAERLGAVCLPYVTHQEGRLCRIKIHPPMVETRQGSPGGAKVEEEMGYLFGVLEGHILAHPEQWWLWTDLGGFGAAPFREEPVGLGDED